MPTSSEALSYRNLDLQHDLTALVSLFKAIEQADHTDEGITEDALRQQLTWSGQNPTPNNWVVRQLEDDILLGYGTLQKAPHDDTADLHIAVHPAWRQQGIGGNLLTRLLERAGELRARTVRAYVDVRHEQANRFVRGHGFEAASTYTRLRVPATHSFPAPHLPQGFTIRSYDQVQRVELYTEAMNRGYEGLWGHIQSTPEETAAWLPQLNHAGVFLLFAPDGSIAGTCRANLDDQHLALIDAPGVVPEYRSAQLYLPLLLTVIHWLLPQEPTTLELESWGDAPDTLALYRSLGFTAVKEEISYRRELM